MKRRKTLSRQVKCWALIVLFAVGLAGSVSAQNSNNLNANAAQLSTPQKLTNGDAFLKEIRRIYDWILKRLQDARSQQDLPATECLGEKLTAVRAVLYLAESASINLKEGAVKGDVEKVNFNYNRLAQSAQRARDMEVEAKLCRGKAGVYTGVTKVILTGDEPTGDVDPTVPPWREPVIVRLTNASSFF